MSLVQNHHTSYRDVLVPMVLTTALFNSGASTNTPLTRFLETTSSLLLSLGLTFIALLAVFARSGIDTWIQFSLYIVPIISMICGHFIFKSGSFKEFLERDINQNESTEDECEFGTCNDFKDKEGSTFYKGLSRFLRIRSLKTCFYPVSLILYQWSVYLIFFHVLGSSEFSGPYNISDHSSFLTRIMRLDLDEQIWLPLYYIFWTAAMYVTGFIACCFILVVDIHKLDIRSFLCLIGNGPMIQKYYRTKRGNQATRNTSHGQYQLLDTSNRVSHAVGLFIRGVSLITGFLTLGLVELGASQVHWETHQTPRNNHVWGNGKVSDSGFTNGSTGSHSIENGKGETSSVEGGSPPKSVTPKEASKLLIQLMTSLETNSSSFKPFLVLLTFFSVTNLVTHVVAMAVPNIDGFTDLHWWTLTRTLFWFLLAIRLLWTVATITNTLSRIIPHISYLRSVGELAGNQHEWDGFLQFAETFQFGSRTYGFPLTLNQVASIVAVVNFSFLIVLSLISNEHK